jgi:hypothetical protein
MSVPEQHSTAYEAVAVDDNYPLHLTTPYKRGPRVEVLQQHLARNRFNHPFYALPDGQRAGDVYGPGMASAVHHAKWWLGYPGSHINGIVRTGALLSFLVSPTNPLYEPLPASYSDRHRKRVAPPLTLGEKALIKAESQVGYSPGHCSSYARWYGLPCDAWCAMFLSWCFAQVGGHFRYSYVPNVLFDAEMGRNHLALTHLPAAGDLAIYVWGGFGSDRNGDHIGIVRATTATSVESVDGNTGDASPGGGGQVLQRVRPRSLVRAFVRVYE